MPNQLHTGWYLLAYDIRGPKRLKKVQRQAAKQTLYAQRSVYLYTGSGSDLMNCVEALQASINSDQDDVRLYCLNGPQDIWFASGPQPPLITLNPEPAQTDAWWSRLWAWIKAHD